MEFHSALVCTAQNLSQADWPHKWKEKKNSRDTAQIKSKKREKKRTKNNKSQVDPKCMNWPYLNWTLQLFCTVCEFILAYAPGFCKESRISHLIVLKESIMRVWCCFMCVDHHVLPQRLIKGALSLKRGLLHLATADWSLLQWHCWCLPSGLPQPAGRVLLMSSKGSLNSGARFTNSLCQH